MGATVAVEVSRNEAGRPVAVLTIDRPDRRNALDVATCGALFDGLQDVVAQGARAVVLTGAGGSFCAGADLGTVRDEDFGPALRRLLEELCATPVVCIAAIEGPALGAGVQLAVSCDLRVVAPSAVLGVPAARLGLMVDHWTIRRVSLVAGAGVARAMLLGDHQFDGAEAFRVGLADRQGGLAEAIAWAHRLADLAPLTLAGHKLGLNRIEAPDDDPAVAAARQRAWASADLEEGIDAFRARRPPRFEGQ